MSSPNMTGSLFMVLAMAAFTFNDSIVKLLSDTLPIPQIIFLRGVLTTILIGAMVYTSKQLASVGHMKRPLVWLRALMEVGATFTFLIGLKHVPIANAAAILSALPLAVTIGSATVLKEAVGWRRWLAILVGFLGVLMIVQPGHQGFNIYSVLILLCVVFAAARDLITRQAPAEIPSLILTLSTSLAITATGFLFMASADHFVSVTPTQASGLVAAAILLTIAYYFIVSAMRVGDVAIVAPFRYTNLIWAISIGFIVFGDPLDWLTIFGSIIIVATGIYTLYRERLNAPERTQKHSMPSNE